MDILSKFFKTKGKDPVEAAIRAVADLEARRDKRQGELKEAKQKLQEQYERAILDGSEPGEQAALSARILEIQGELDAFNALVTKARKEAVAAIAAGKPQRVEKIEELHHAIRKKKASLQKDQMREVARLARKIGGQTAYPTNNTAGSMLIPSTVLDREEIQAIFEEVGREDLQEDKRQGEIAELNRELQRLNLLERTGVPELAVTTLAEEVKRGLL
ncbi:MAG: hypothetical protein ACOWWM_16260 [Desulfobacterales bacterium]